MGVVYLGVAWDGSPVAVKVLRPELADDQEFRHRFQREVSALTRVRGVCTVRVIEADTQSPRPFMVTEYAEGPSLAEYIDSHGWLSPDMLYGLATGLAEALTVIHAAGLVHRDLKPSNVILADSGPKVIDFGIAQALDAVSVTKTGMMVGSSGFMAPEQISGRPGQAADIFVWGVTVAYAATGQSPFGTGDTNAVLYRVLHSDPDIGAVPEPLRPLVAAALAKSPEHRPTAGQLLDQLTGALRAARAQDSPTQTILSQTWSRPRSAAAPLSAPPGARGAQAGAGARQPEGSLLLDPAPRPAGPAGGELPPTKRRRITRRVSALGAAALGAAAVTAAVIIAVLHGHTTTVGPAANTGNTGSAAANALPAYPGQSARGVFQQIDRIVAAGNTMVTTGSQQTGSQQAGGAVRQQFFVSTDVGRTWKLAPVRLPGGGQPPLGYPATRIAGGPRGWMAAGDNAIWTSPDGQTWTLAGTRGITPRERGDVVNVVTATPGGFLAAGYDGAGAAQQAVIWTSRDGVTWQRQTASQLGLQEPGGTTPGGLDFAAFHGNVTVIGDRGAGLWQSTDSGAHWTLVTAPVDHGARNAISGVSFDRSGFVLVRPGTAANGASDGVAYFSADGRTWQYAGTIDRAGGWSPDAVKGSDYGFVVTGSARGQYVAYTSTGTGSRWLPTGPLGETSNGLDFNPVVGPGGNVVAAGNTNSTRTGQEGLLIKADTAGNLEPVSLGAIPGGLVPEQTVQATAVAGSVQIAVGSANGYPAVWRRVPGGPWTLVSRLAQVSSDQDLGGLSTITHGPNGWLATGPGGFTLTSADGSTWQPSAAITHDLAGVTAVQAASGPRGYVITGTASGPGGAHELDLWWSRDLSSWTRARGVSGTSGSDQVLAAAAGPSGFVSAGSRDGQPAVWTTPDGQTWTAVSVPLPSGASGGVIQQVAVSGKNAVALGQQATARGIQPLAERSDDGGQTWRPVPFSAPGAGISFTALAAGQGGFTAAARFGPADGTSGAAVWSSADGTTWMRSQVSGLTSGGSHTVTALAASGSAVTGIDTVQAQASQQFAVLNLPAG
jgi:hypothetical protein